MPSRPTCRSPTRPAALATVSGPLIVAAYVVAGLEGVCGRYPLPVEHLRGARPGLLTIAVPEALHRAVAMVFAAARALLSALLLLLLARRYRGAVIVSAACCDLP